MKRFVLSLILLSASFLGRTTVAQLPIFESRKAEAEILRYNQGGPNQAIINHMLVRLSTGTNLGVDRARVIIAHDVVLRITRVDQYHMQIYAGLENFLVEGQTAYKGFDMAPFLLPTAVKFELKHLSGLNAVKHLWPFQEVAIGGDPAPIANFRQSDSTNFRLDKLELLNKAFVYKESAQGLFDSRLRLIDEYYNAGAELDVLYDELLGIHPDQLEMLPNMEQRLIQVEGRIQRLADKAYETQLNLGPEQDPNNFVPRFADVQQLASQVRQQLTQNLANLPALYFERGRDALMAGNRNQAIQDFQQSLQLDPGFAPARFQLAQIDYQEGRIEAALPNLLSILRQANADPETKNASLQLLADYQGRQLSDAKAANDRKAYQDAIALLDLSAGLCTEFPGLQCEAKYDYEYTRAHQGIYKALLADARIALDEQRLDDAEQAAQAAIDYQQSHTGSIPDGVDSQRAIDEVNRMQYNKMLRDASAALDQGQLADANGIVESAIAFQGSHQRAVPSARSALQLQDRVQQAVYARDLAAGRSQLGSRRWAEALRLLESARGMEGDWGIVADPAVYEDAREAARGVALDKYNEGKRMANGNRLADARRIVNEAGGLVTRYDLSADQELSALQASLQDAIFNQECLNAQNRFNGIIAEAEGFRSLKKFIDARAAFQQAIQAAREASSCGIDQSPADNGMKEINAAADYQVQMLEVYDMVDRGLHGDAIRGFQSAGQNFETANLSQFGLTHGSLLEFIQGSGRFSFILHGAYHYMDTGDLEEALSLARNLAQKGFSNSETKRMQLRLGQTLAQRDKMLDSTGSPKVKALNYTRGDKALKKVYKGYVKYWKKM